MPPKTRWGLWLPPLPKDAYVWLRQACEQFNVSQFAVVLAGLRALQRLGAESRETAVQLLQQAESERPKGGSE